MTAKADGGEHTGPEVRVSDADGLMSSELLERHIADGLLSLDEFFRGRATPGRPGRGAS